MLITWTYFSVLKYIIYTHYLLYSNMSTFFFVLLRDKTELKIGTQSL